MSEPVTAVARKAAQKAGAKRATFDALRNKKPVEREFSITLGEDKVSFLFRAVGAVEYEKLLTKCPPTPDQKAEGATFDPDRFAPILLARVCVEPVLSETEWREIWTSEEWSRGETADIFYSAVNLCSRGLTLDPTVPG
jgi:hypothetical protein